MDALQSRREIYRYQFSTGHGVSAEFYGTFGQRERRQRVAVVEYTAFGRRRRSIQVVTQIKRNDVIRIRLVEYDVVHRTAVIERLRLYSRYGVGNIDISQCRAVMESVLRNLFYTLGELDSFEHSAVVERVITDEERIASCILYFV